MILRPGRPGLIPLTISIGALLALSYVPLAAGTEPSPVQLQGATSSPIKGDAMGVAGAPHFGDIRESSLTLVTGQSYRILHETNGTVVQVLAEGNAKGTDFSTFQRGGHTYLLPKGVDLNRFDLGLFDLTQLLKDNFTSALELMVELAAPQDLRQAKEGIMATTTTDSGMHAPTSLPGKMPLSFGAFTMAGSPLLSIRVNSSAESAVYGYLASSTTVRHVYLNAVVRTFSTPSDNGGIYAIDAVAAAARYHVNGSGVRIAILDTGIYPEPDFEFPGGSSKIVFSANLSDDNSTTDYFGHGTHVAGIAAGTGLESEGAFVGVATGASLLNIKVLDRYGSGFDSWIIQGIQLAVNNGANIISMSFGGPPDPLLDAAVNWAVSKGVICVSAAGNSGSYYYSIGSPGEASGALTVGASFEPGWQSAPATGGVVAFSSMGPEWQNESVKPDLTAPGWQIISDRAPGSYLAQNTAPVPGYGGNYMMLSGTSMSTPFVSGAAALVLQAHPGWGPTIVEDALESTASLLNSTWNGVPYISPYVEGTGMINVSAAISPGLVFEPAILNLGNVNQGSRSLVVNLYNPGVGPVSARLSLSAVDVNDGENATSYIGLNQSAIVVPGGQTKHVLLSVRGNINSSVFGGYIFAFDSAGKRLLAHSALSFNSLHQVRVKFEGPNGQPIVGVPVTHTYYNGTWMQFSQYSGGITNSQGEVTIPAFEGRNIFMTANFSSDVIYLEGVLDVTAAPSANLTVGGASLLPLTLVPSVRSPTFTYTTSEFLSFYFHSSVGAPPFVFTLPSVIGYGIFLPDQYSKIYVTPDETNDYVGVTYQYAPSGQLPTSHQMVTTSGLDLYTLFYNDYNITKPVTELVDNSTLASLPTTYTSDQVAGAAQMSYTGLPCPYIGNQRPFFCFGEGATLSVLAPLEVDNHIVPNTPFYVSVFNNDFDFFRSGPAGSVTVDRFGANPFFALNLVGEGGAAGVSPILSAASPLGVAHIDQVGSCTYNVVSYSPAFGSQNQTTACPGQVSAYITPGSHITAAYRFSPGTTLSTMVSENKSFVVPSSPMNNWFGGTDVVIVQPQAMNALGMVPAGDERIQFAFQYATNYTNSMSSVSVEYSVDGGASWSAGTSVKPIATVYSDPCPSNDMSLNVCQFLGPYYPGLPKGAFASAYYQAVLGGLRQGELVSIRILGTDASGGKTTYAAINAFQVGPGASVETYAATFTTSTPVPMGWALELDAFNFSQVASSSTGTITLGLPSGTYGYTMLGTANISIGLQYMHEAGVLLVVNKGVSASLDLRQQVRLAFVETDEGGTSPFPPPVMQCISDGRTYSLGIGFPGSPTIVWVDHGTRWNATAAIPGASTVQRWATGNSTGIASESGRNNLIYFAQVSLGFGFTVAGNATGYSAPVVKYSSLGRLLETLAVAYPAGAPRQWVDSQTLATYQETLSGLPADQRLITRLPSVTIYGPGEVDRNYVLQDMLSVRYSVVGGGNPPAPVLYYLYIGAPNATVMSTAASVVWADPGGYSFASLLQGSNPSERWYAPGSSNGTVSPGVAISPTYYHQFFVNFTLTARGQPNFDSGLGATKINGTAFGVPGTQLCEISPNISAAATCRAWVDAGSPVEFPTSLLGSSRETRWEAAPQPTLIVNSSVGVDVYYFKQVAEYFSYSSVAGAPPQGPGLLCTRFGVSETCGNVTPSQEPFWIDFGSSWKVSNPIAGAVPLEIWLANANLSGSAAPGMHVAVTYYHQYMVILSYQVSGGGTPRPPSLNVTSLGRPLSIPINESGANLWMDAGTKWTMPSVLQSLSPGERWITNSTVQGTIDGPLTLGLVYQHEYLVSFLTVGQGDISPSGSTWVGAGSSVTVSAQPAFGSYFVGWSASSGQLQFISSGQTQTVKVVGPGTVTAQFASYLPYVLILAVAATAAAILAFAVFRLRAKRTN